MALENINNLNVLQLGYDYYEEFNNRYYENALKYANQKSIPIRYFHINMELSKNYDPEIGIQISMKEFIYDIYEFVPVIEMTPFTQQANFDPTQQGTSYSITFSCTIVGIKDPLPGDLITFYSSPSIDSSQIFRVKSAQYLRTLNNSLSEPKYIYQLELENAPLKLNDLDYIISRVNSQNFYLNDTGNFFDKENYSYFDYIKNNKNNLNDLFNSIYCYVGYLNACNINAGLKILQRNYNFPNIIPIININNDYDINDLMIPFDQLYKLLNEDPITGEPLIQDEASNDSVTVTQVSAFNNMEEVEDSEDSKDSEETIEISYFDKTCNSTCLDDEFKNKDILIFRVIKTDEGYNEERSEFFEYYNNLYKFFYAYRKIDKDFFKKATIAKNNFSVINNSEIFYNLDALAETVYERLYDPGYYISYNGGSVQFN